MKKLRYATFKEKQVTELLKSKGIITVQDLHLDNICEVFKIDVTYHRGRSFCIHEDEENYALIFIDKRLPYFEQRFTFFHEFAHFLYHSGDQKKLSKEMVTLQEQQAHWIALYSSMPRHIFEPMAIRHQSVEKLQELFELPKQYIIERFNSIRRERTLQNFQYRIQRSERSRRKKSLQPGQVYDSTLSVLEQFKQQVGEERLSYDVTRLLR